MIKFCNINYHKDEFCNICVLPREANYKIGAKSLCSEHFKILYNFLDILEVPYDIKEV